MNTYSLPPLISSILFLIIGGFCFLKKRKSTVSLTFALLCLATFWWQFSWFILFNTTNERSASYIVKFGYTGIIFIPITFFHFFVSFLKAEKDKWLVFVSYIIGLVLVLMLWTTDYFVNGFYRYYWGYYPRARFLHPVHLAQLSFLAIRALVLLVSHWKKQRLSPLRYNQVKYVLLALLAYIPAGSDYAVNYGIEFYPIGFIFIFIFALITTYAIVTYRLMDISVAITKGTVFAVVYAFVLGIPVGVGFWGKSYIFDKIGPNWWLVPVGMALVLASLGPAIYGFIRRKAEAALFAERQRYQENLIALGKEMTLTKDLRSLLVLIIRNVTREIGISHARIYLLDRKTNEYVREVHYGKERRRQYGDSLYKGAPLVRLLSRRRDSGPILREEVISHFETNEPEHLEEIKAQLRSMGAAVLLPAFIGEELVAFLALGTKRSQEIYTPDDLAMFKILAGQAGLAIENAQFYHELKEAQATILQAAKLSSIGELAAGFAHQIDNPLGVISLGCQLCTQDIKEWLGRRDLPEGDRKVLMEMEDRMNKVIDTAHRAADLVQRIRGYAKPADRDLEPTDLNSVIEDALSLAQYQITHGGINVIKDIPQDLPKIKGIGVQLEQVFLNMTINACEAMAGKKGELAISARVAKEEPHKIEAILADNGCGIPKENLRRLFDLFYTTKGSQGTGVGLSMAYRIVKDHNGDINVESEIGKGTRFTVSLPIWEEKSE
ncbi:MAG: ATP-binding protein [Candidatus Aminicenantes bacterium]|nr:ATP-binding protein [Candidatus Aminicenantes bacterium]